ncbi:MAG: hypothetical protein Q6373_003135 [Candidatus Sigynarchaeota archaeon]
MLILDTCSWLKIKMLDESNTLSLKQLIYANDPYATHQLITELRHYLKDYIDYTKLSIQRIDIDKYKTYSEKELDDADLSIIGLGRMNPRSFVISDDHPELEVLNAFNIRCGRLSEYLLFLVKENLLRKNDANRAIKKLRQMKNIKEKEKNRLMQKINLI